MSHFSEGRKGGPVDVKQKTLSDFIITEDVTRRGFGDQALSESNINDNTSAVDGETSSCSYNHEPRESIDFVDTYQIPDLDQTDARHCHNEAETAESSDLVRILILILNLATENNIPRTKKNVMNFFLLG